MRRGKKIFFFIVGSIFSKRQKVDRSLIYVHKRANVVVTPSRYPSTPVAETRPSPKQNGQQRNSSRDDAIREREVPGASHPDTNRLMIGHKTVKTLATTTTTIHCGQSHALFISSALLPCIPKRGPLCVYKRAGYRRSYPVTNRTTASFLSFLPRFMATSINGNFGRPFFFPSSKFYLFFLATGADENLPVDNTWTLV